MNNSFYKLIEIISDLENVEINEILNKRTDSGFRCRSIITYILYISYGFTFREISKFLKRNPSSISRSYYSLIKELDNNEKKYISRIKQKLDAVLSTL